MDEKILKDVVRSVIQEMMAKQPGATMQRDVEPQSGVFSVKGSSVKTEPFPFDIGPAGKGVGGIERIQADLEAADPDRSRSGHRAEADAADRHAGRR